MKKQIRIKTNWEAITLKEYEQIEQILKSDIPVDYKAVNLLSVLSGEEVGLFENIPLHQFSQLTKVLNFLTAEMPEAKVKDSYEINGRKYVVKADIPSISTAQYIDYQTYMKEKPVDLQKVISVFLIPEGHSYNDGYKIEEVLADIHDMKIMDVQALGFFYSEAIRSIHNSYEGLFVTPNEEDEDSNGENPGGSGAFEQFGIIPFVLKVCEIAHTPFEEVMKWSVCQVFYLTTYSIQLERLRDMQRKHWQKNH